MEVIRKSILLFLLIMLCMPVTVNADFKDNGDGTVTDNLTGLMWQQCTRGQIWKEGIGSMKPSCEGEAEYYSWPKALSEAVIANSDPSSRYHDWRIPNITELESLVVIKGDTAPAIDVNDFPNTPDYYYWTSTLSLNIDGPPDVMSVNFDEGSVGWVYLTDEDRLHVRLVRGGDSFDAFCTECVSPTNSEVEWDQTRKVFNGDNADVSRGFIRVTLYNYIIPKVSGSTPMSTTIKGKSVRLQSDPGSAGAPNSDVSDDSGMAYFEVRSTAKGTVTYTAFGDGVEIKKKATVIYEPTVPGRPINVLTTPESLAVKVSWVKPQLDGGDPITGYTVTAAPGGKTCTAGAQGTSCTIDGLTNFTPYTFTVKATNKNGDSLPSDPPVSATPIPGCPVGNSSFVANPARILANNLDTATLTATLVDARGAPVANRTVLLSQGGGQSQITPATQLKTNAQGVATFQVKNAQVEVVNYTLSLPYAGEEYPNCSNTLTTTVEFESNLLSVASVQCVDKDYDGNNQATLTGCTLDKSVPNVACAIAPSPLNKGTFDHGKAYTDGQAKPVTPQPNSIVLSGSDAQRYKLSPTFPKASCKINQRRLTGVQYDIDSNGREYDATTQIDKALIKNCTPQGLITGDTVSCDLSAVKASLLDKNAGAAKPLKIEGLKLTGQDGGNYAVQNPYTGTINITRKEIKVASVVVEDRKYGGMNELGNTDARLVSCALDGLIPGDAVTCSITNAKANFSNPNADAVNPKPVEVTGLTHLGIDALNYSFNGLAIGSARILPFELTKAGVTLKDRVYAGQNVRDVLIENCTIAKPFPGDDIGCDPTQAMAMLNGDGRYSPSPKPVTVTNLLKNGVHANNYIFPPTAEGSVMIKQRPVAMNIKPEELAFAAIFAQTNQGKLPVTNTKCALIDRIGNVETGLVAEDKGLVGCTASAEFERRDVGTNRPIKLESIRDTAQLTGSDTGVVKNYVLDKANDSEWTKTGTITELPDCRERQAKQEVKLSIAYFLRCSNGKLQSTSFDYDKCVSDVKAEIMEPQQADPTVYGYQPKLPYGQMKGYPDPENGCYTPESKNRSDIATAYIRDFEELLGGQVEDPVNRPENGSVFGKYASVSNLPQNKGVLRRLRAINEFIGKRQSVCLASLADYENRLRSTTLARLTSLNRYKGADFLAGTTPDQIADDLYQACKAMVGNRSSKP